jgi:hypothetical protein
MTNESPEIARGIEAFTTDYLTDVGNGEVTYTIGTRLPGLRRDDEKNPDGSWAHPAQDGDVLSIQPDNTMQTRPAGTNGNYERAKATPPWLVYRPIGERTFLYPLAGDWPNK